MRIEFHQGSVFLPALKLWLDAHEPQTGPGRVFVSHAHSDHIAEHREVILSAPTAKLMSARLPGTRLEHVLEYNQPRLFKEQDVEYQVTLEPAGHIFGSAMSLIEAGGSSLLYTGDFKLRRGLSAEACEPRRADTLIMETTYGRPQYSFPPTAAVMEGIIRFCRETLNNDATAVLLGYSLGKSQELLCGLADAGLPLMLHGTVWRLTQIYEQFGQCFPKYERYEPGSVRGKVLLCPPSAVNTAMVRNLGSIRSAILTGWAVDPNCRFRYRCDAAFPLSDHADFPDLIEMVKQVQPRQVFTLHGFAADFARTLRELGFNAQALSENEQFELAIKTESVPARTRYTAKAPKSPPSLLSEASPVETGVFHAFAEFAQTCRRISETTSKLEKVRLLGDYLRSLAGPASSQAATWFTGRPFPGSQNKVLQLGWAALRDALCAVGNVTEAELHQVYLKHSDLGETAGEILEGRESSPRALSLAAVDDLFSRLHAARGPLAKTPLLIGALEQCSAPEAKYLVKIIAGDLRIGLKEGLVEEGIASAFGKPADDVRQANLLLGDIGQTAKLAAENRLNESTLAPFRPLKFMLASPEETAKDIWERMHERGEAAKAAENEAVPAENSPPAKNMPLWIEDKYDGIRCQLHKAGHKVALYSRDLKDMTLSFLELADAARGLKQDFILDGEIVAMRGDEILPFADLQKRLGRRDGDLFMRDEVPIKYVAFDLLWLGGEDSLGRPLRDRRRALESLTPLPDAFRLAQIRPASSAEEIETAFDAARAVNNEGLMIKDPESAYSPGRRGLAWLKLKKAMATLDCVVVGAEYGHGKRSKVLSDYTFAVLDESTGEFKTIGKAYSGLTDAEISGLTTHFLKKAVRQHGRYFEVEPDTVLEIAFDKIQASDRHNSGLALRFPRIARIRSDKSIREIDTLAAARKMAGLNS